MILSRELGKRIWGGSTNIENGGGGVSSDAIAGLLTGYAKESWVDEHYISIDFFSRLFQAHGTENGSEIDVMPNDMETTITSVQSMFGFWTNLYISALGSNGAAPAGISLGMLTDVTISGTPSAGQVLTFDAVTQMWVNGNAQAGATALANLTDVLLSQVQNGQTLLYDSTTSKWYNSALKTINGQSLLGSGDISVGGGASGNYLPLSGGTMVGQILMNLGITDVLHIGTAPFTWGGFEQYFNLIYGIDSSGNVRTFIGMPHIPYLQNGSRSYTGPTVGACIRFEGGIGVNNWFDLLCLDGGFSMVSSNRETWFGISASNLVMVTYKNQWLNEAHIHLTRTDTSANDNAAIIGVTNGNLHVDAYNNKDLYLNYYSGRQGLIVRNNGITQALSPSDQSGWSNRIAAGTSSMAFLGEFPGLLLPGLYAHNLTFSAWAPLGVGGSYITFYISGSYCGLWNSTGLGIGTTSPSYALHVVGTIYATGAITALSDARKKDITGEADVTVEQIAHAPAVQFLWKDKERRKDGQQVGTLAQYWQTVLPEVVMDKGGELSMQYGVAALVSAIVTARKVVDHERRITELEKENERLRKEVEQLRLN